MIARFRVGSVASGECSVCHGVLVVRNARDKDRVSEMSEPGDRLNQAFEDHIRRKHSPDR
jgi:hypothetical protein